MSKLNVVVPADLSVWPYNHTSMIANSQLDFYGPDSKELFERNLKYTNNTWSYRVVPVTYNFNDAGLRMSKNVKDVSDNYILYSGTSYGMGIGIPENERISDKVASELKTDYINFSGPTFSIKLQTLSFFNLLASSRPLPKILIIEYAPSYGYTMYSKNSFVCFYSKHLPSKKDYKLQLNAYNELLQTDFFINEACMYRNMLVATCSRLGVKLVEVSFNKDDPFVQQNDIDVIDTDCDDPSIKYGRDLIYKDGQYSGHPGVGVHEYGTSLVLRKL